MELQSALKLYHYVKKLFPVPNPTLEFKIPKLGLVIDIEITCSWFRARASVWNTFITRLEATDLGKSFLQQEHLSHCSLFLNERVCLTYYMKRNRALTQAFLWVFDFIFYCMTVHTLYNIKYRIWERKKLNMQRLSLRFRSQQFFLSKICREIFYPNLKRFVWRSHSSQGFWLVAEKKSNFAGFSGPNSRKKWPILREFRGNFWGQFRWKMRGKEWRISWELPDQISLESDWFCAD